jgi:hypothetical protein
LLKAVFIAFFVEKGTLAGKKYTTDGGGLISGMVRDAFRKINGIKWEFFPY